ncbi:MAG: four helix bundle protein [Flavobacteriaceae bacterium]
MTQIQSYKDLLIWQKGIALVKSVYLLCKELPKEEIFGLQSQMKRAAISIPSNIAEGYGRNYSQNYIQFLRIARGSLLELETQLIISKELKLIGNKLYQKVQGLITEENKMLNAFIKSISKEK